MKALFLVLAVTAALAQTTTRAPLQAESERKSAAKFVLHDANGKAATLEEYRGKVVLLDFWATWCTGCKLEIPWFSEFQKSFGAKGLAVVGVSLDEDGWKVLKPYLDQHPVPYRMLLGDQATAKSYGIEAMPDTFLIDRQGRIAAAYRAAIVDRKDMEANIRALIAAK